jgi:DNA-binding response OmpR family regulator
VSARVLLIEDNIDLALGFRRSLELEGHDVSVAADGESGLAMVRDTAPDLVILDLMLPGLDGFQVLRSLRADGHDVPVLILSAKGEEVDKVQGFRLGADSYAVKPVGVLELIARVDAMLKRPPSGRLAASARERYAFGAIEVDAGTRSCSRNGAPVMLSPKEFDLLIRLLRAAGTVVPRDALLREVWGYKRAVATRTVDAHIALLRSKIEDDPGSPRHILTVRKAGYRLEAGPPGATSIRQSGG